MLFAQKDQQSPAHGRVIVLHLRDDFHGHEELPVVYTNWRDCRLRGGLVSTARYRPQGARMEDTLLLSRNRCRAGYRWGENPFEALGDRVRLLYLYYFENIRGRGSCWGQA